MTTLPTDTPTTPTEVPEEPTVAGVPARDGRDGGQLGAFALRRRGARSSPPRARHIALALVVVLLAPVAWSYGHAVGAPGQDSLGIRSTEWLKDHGGRSFVAWAERTWYEHHAPKKGGEPSAKDIPIVAPPQPTTTLVPFDSPAPPHLIVNPALPGEGVWQPGPRSAQGAPFVYTTFMQPSTEYSSPDHWSCLDGPQAGSVRAVFRLPAARRIGLDPHGADSGRATIESGRRVQLRLQVCPTVTAATTPRAARRPDTRWSTVRRRS